jgi:hypothetical protein
MSGVLKHRHTHSYSVSTSFSFSLSYQLITRVDRRCREASGVTTLRKTLEVRARTDPRQWMSISTPCAARPGHAALDLSSLPALRWKYASPDLLVCRHPPKLPTMPAARRSRVSLSGKTLSSPFQSIPVCRKGTFHSLAPLTGVDIEPSPSLESSHHRDQFCLSQAKLSQFPVGTRVVPRRNFVNYYYSLPLPPGAQGTASSARETCSARQHHQCAV